MFENTTPMIMGILNVTPDSFSDGGKYTGIEASIRQASAIIEDGADLIDIGGESTRPGALPVPASEQIRRVVPVIQAIRKLDHSIPISIDTCSCKVAQAAFEAGAVIINDISAGSLDPKMLPFVAENNCSIILMHMQGVPKTMQDHPYYADVVNEVKSILISRINSALDAGIKPQNIAIDPGIGFGKRKQDNIDLLAQLGQFVNLGYPVLLGTSRKRFMGSICKVSEPWELVTATAVTTALGVSSGVKIFRVHDVKPNRQAADIAWAIKQAS